MGARMGKFVFSSVIAPEDPKDGKLVAGALPQIDRCFENMKLMMQSAGGSRWRHQPRLGVHEGFRLSARDGRTLGEGLSHIRRPACAQDAALRSRGRHADPGAAHGLSRRRAEELRSAGRRPRGSDPDGLEHRTAAAILRHVRHRSGERESGSKVSKRSSRSDCAMSSHCSNRRRPGGKRSVT